MTGGVYTVYTVLLISLSTLFIRPVDVCSKRIGNKLLHYRYEITINGSLWLSHLIPLFHVI